MTGWLGVSLGDVTGIGPEVALKAITAEAPGDSTKYLLIGDADGVNRLSQKLGLDLPLKKFSSYGDTGRFFVTNPSTKPLLENLAAGSPAAANAAIASLRDGAERCLRRELDALSPPAPLAAPRAWCCRIAPCRRSCAGRPSSSESRRPIESSAPRR